MRIEAPDSRWLIPYDQASRDAVIETGFWLAVAMLLLAVLIGVLVELFLPAPPPEPVSTYALLRKVAVASSRFIWS